MTTKQAVFVQSSQHSCGTKCTQEPPVFSAVYE